MLIFSISVFVTPFSDVRNLVPVIFYYIYLLNQNPLYVVSSSILLLSLLKKDILTLLKL